MSGSCVVIDRIWVCVRQSTHVASNSMHSRPSAANGAGLAALEGGGGRSVAGE